MVSVPVTIHTKLTESEFMKFKIVSLFLAILSGYAIGLTAAQAQRHRKPRRDYAAAKACIPTSKSTGIRSDADSIAMTFHTACGGGNTIGCNVTYRKVMYRWVDNNWKPINGGNTCTSKTILCGGSSDFVIGQAGLYWWEPGSYMIACSVYSGTCASQGAQLAFRMEYFEL